MLPTARTRRLGPSVFGLAVLFAAGCCSSPEPEIPSQDIYATANTLESLRVFAAAEGESGSISIHEAREIAIETIERQGEAPAIWDSPTFVVNDCYFFTVKKKFGHRLTGVLVHSESGEAAIVHGALTVEP